MTRFVPEAFEPPVGLDGPGFRLEPLGPGHNEADFGAWTSSIEHIRATPGFEGSSWPHAMTIDDNRHDLIRHAADFAARTGFTYTVLDPDGVVIGCVYIYPSDRDGVDARVRSWVRAEDAALDEPLHRTVADWLRDRWPFERVEYAQR